MSDTEKEKVRDEQRKRNEGTDEHQGGPGGVVKGRTPEEIKGDDSRSGGKDSNDSDDDSE